jgi:hypothetical protein
MQPDKARCDDEKGTMEAKREHKKESYKEIWQGRGKKASCW